jgi:ketosteroid isomerase-like protein
MIDNVQLLKDAYEAFGRGDIASVLGAFDPNIQWREAEGNPYEPAGTPWVGPEAITQNLFMKLGTEWDGFTVSPREFHAAGNTVVVEGRYTGVYNASGKSLDAQVCHVWKLRDGRVTSFQQYVDTAQLQEVMGARVSGLQTVEA